MIEINLDWWIPSKINCRLYKMMFSYTKKPRYFPLIIINLFYQIFKKKVFILIERIMLKKFIDILQMKVFILLEKIMLKKVNLILPMIVKLKLNQ